MTSWVPVVGIPFCNKTSCEKVIKLIAKTPNKVIVEMDSKTKEAPYGDTFTC